MADHKENVQYRIPSNKIRVLKGHGNENDFCINRFRKGPLYIIYIIQVLKPMRFYLRTCRDIPNKKSTPVSTIAVR